MKRQKKEIPLKLILLLVILIFFGLVIFLFEKNLKPVWDGKNRINIVVDFKNIFLFILAPKKEALTIIKLPNNLYIDIPAGYGSYKIGAIFELAKVGKKRGENIFLFRRAFIDNFNFFPDAWIKVDGLIKQNNYDLKFDKKQIKKITSTKHLLLNFLKFLKNSKTNLTLTDNIKLFLALSNIREDKIQIYDLEELDLTRDFKLNDGSTVKIISQSKLPAVSQKFFSDEGVKEENLRISIFNATEKAGLAKKAENLISALGGVVIQAATQEEISGKTICQAENKEVARSYTFLKIKQIFNCQLKFKNNGDKGDLSLIIGLDY